MYSIQPTQFRSSASGNAIHFAVYAVFEQTHWPNLWFHSYIQVVWHIFYVYYIYSILITMVPPFSHTHTTHGVWHGIRVDTDPHSMDWNVRWLNTKYGEYIRIDFVYIVQSRMWFECLINLHELHRLDNCYYSSFLPFVPKFSLIISEESCMRIKHTETCLTPSMNTNCLHKEPLINSQAPCSVLARSLGLELSIFCACEWNEDSHLSWPCSFPGQLYVLTACSIHMIRICTGKNHK